MIHLIDKDALVAKIDNWQHEIKMCAATIPLYGRQRADAALEYEILENVRQSINTLEVKEDNPLTEKKIEKELAEIYLKIFDKKFSDKLPKLKGKQLADFKNFVNTCEQTFSTKYFDYHATQGKLFEKMALLWAVWGKEHLGLEVKEVGIWKTVDNINSPQADRNKIYCVITKHEFVSKNKYLTASVVNHPQDEDLLQWKCTEFPFRCYDMCEGDKYLQIV